MNETPPPDRAPDQIASAAHGADPARREPSAASAHASDRQGSEGRDDAAPSATGREAAPGSPGPAANGQGNVGDALRSIYQQTIEENVPDEMLDLLGRLD